MRAGRRGKAAWRAGWRRIASANRNDRFEGITMRFRWTGLVTAVALAASVGAASAQKTLKVVMHSDLKIVDPIWTTAYITRNHGYMVYDTLFAMDEKGEIKPQ